ncbi:hypothetical protein H1R20_g5978, partial [Candolleomyces eurysporus]
MHHLQYSANDSRRPDEDEEPQEFSSIPSSSSDNVSDTTAHATPTLVEQNDREGQYTLATFPSEALLWPDAQPEDGGVAELVECHSNVSQGTQGSLENLVAQPSDPVQTPDSPSWKVVGQKGKGKVTPHNSLGLRASIWAKRQPSGSSLGFSNLKCAEGESDRDDDIGNKDEVDLDADKEREERVAFLMMVILCMMLKIKAHRNREKAGWKRREAKRAREATKRIVEHVAKSILNAVATTVSLRFALMEIELIFQSQPSESPTKRVWWCPTGPLALLPIRAAGKCMEGRNPDTTSIFDYAISSYTPTVPALANAFKRRKLVAESDTTMRTQTTPASLLVNQSNAPGLAPIPGTTEETRAIAQLSLRKGLETFSLDEAQATIDSVITKINDFSSIHLACRAFQNTVEPLRSGFALHNGRLELSRLIQTRRSRDDGASIAFLSACQTSIGDNARPGRGYLRVGKRQINVPVPPVVLSAPGNSGPSQESNLNGPVGEYDDSPDFVVTVEKKRRCCNRRTLLVVGIVSLIVVTLLIVLPVYFVVVKRRSQQPAAAEAEAITRGGNGSQITMEDGSQFMYLNRFGGYWVYNPDNPYDDGAQPNSWTPVLNASWDFTKNRIHGVNLAGLFVLEPLISPSPFQRYPQAVDEWSLSVAMSNDPANGGLGQIEEHYKTFITEKDIAEIAGAGLTWVRLPIGFWAIETFPGEPFLAKTSWNYVIRVLQWCRKYGLRVNLVLNAVPGSQNGFNHGGKRDSLNFLNGVMGMANAQRTLYYIRVLAEFISQPEWDSYVEAHRIIREITGYGKGLGPFVVIDSGFQDPSSNVFNGFMNGADRVVIERHVYVAFSEVAMESVAAGTVQQFCSLGASMDRSRSSFGITVAGAFSPAFLDCGLFVNGVEDISRYRGDCSFWENSTGWGLALKASLTQLVLAQMDALGDYFFFTWKAVGACKAIDESYTPTWDGTYSAWMTGGDGAFVATDAAEYPWPPGTISNTGTSSPTLVLPTYTATGSPITLPAPTFTDTKGKAIVLSHGSPLGRVPAPTLVAGCDYPDAWNALNATFTQPNSWTPALKEPWNFESHRIHGVNLGGVGVSENLTAPTLFQKCPQALDEWTLSLAMANDPNSGGLNQIEEHHRTFITEQDIAEIAGAGLTWVRIPIGFWAIETFPGEPFLAKTSWKYIVRVLQWCRKYGLRVNLSLYTVPGSAHGTPNYISYSSH